MIDLGRTEFYIAGPTLPRGEFEVYSTELFDEWEARLQRDFNVPDYSLSLEVEEGSVSGIAIVAAALSAVYLGIGNYGSFISGLETIRKQVRAAGAHLAEQAASPFVRLNLRPRVTQRGGTLGKLQTLFRKVQRQEISAENALHEAEQLLGPEAVEVPDFMNRLSGALVSVRHYEQLLLPIDLPEEVVSESEPELESVPIPVGRPAATKTQLPPKPRFRIEVWRNSRSGKREVRITEL
jgi:hypothetical protein